MMNFSSKDFSNPILELIEYIVKTFSNEGELVLDSCMGSGTTGVACARTNRRFVGFELDEDIYNCAKRRIEDSQPVVETPTC